MRSDEAAFARAEEMLADSVTPDQFASYESDGYIEVQSRTIAGRTYRIDGWRPVAVHDNGRFVGAVCIRPTEHMPGPDVLLARKLMIESDESAFLAAGNWLHPAWRPAGAAPTIFLLLALLSPWLLHLRMLGRWGVVVSLAVLAFPALGVAYRAWRHRRAVIRA